MSVIVIVLSVLYLIHVLSLLGTVLSVLVTVFSVLVVLTVLVSVTVSSVLVTLLLVLVTVLLSRRGELWTQKLKSHLLRRQSLKVLTLKPKVGWYRAILAMLIARDFFQATFYSSSSFTCIFSKPLLSFSCVSCG